MFLKKQFTFKPDFRIKQYRELKQDEVHLWHLFLPSLRSRINSLYLILCNSEKAYANSFNYYKDQERFIITRGILRYILANYLEKAPESINIIYTPWGKPYISDIRPLFFNVSHAGDYSLLAFTSACEIGIDLELMNYNLEFDEMAKTIFSIRELSYWNKLTSEKKVDYFYKVWVGREAFLKALGKGWLEDDEEIRGTELFFTPNTGFGSVYKNNYGTLEYFQLIPEYKSAFFTKGTVLKPIIINWTEKEDPT